MLNMFQFLLTTLLVFQLYLNIIITAPVTSEMNRGYLDVNLFPPQLSIHYAVYDDIGVYLYLFTKLTY